MRQSWETMTSVSAGHIILTPTQPVGSGRPQRESNPGPPYQESRALPQSYRPLKKKNRQRQRSTERATDINRCGQTRKKQSLKGKAPINIERGGEIEQR